MDARQSAFILTKREFIAAMLMQGLISGVILHGDQIKAVDELGVFAKEAVLAADALLAELKKGK